MKDRPAFEINRIIQLTKKCFIVKNNWFINPSPLLTTFRISSIVNKLFHKRVPRLTFIK